MIPYTYKFRLYPNKEQEKYFVNCFGCTRFLWNLMLGERKDYYDKNKTTLKREVSYYKNKTEYSFLKKIDSLALCNVKLNLDIAYDRFFKGIANFPKFKAKKKSRDSYTTNNQDNNIRIENSYIKLPKIGFVKLKLHRQIEGNIKHVTISKEKSGEFYIAILVETNKDFKLLVPKTSNKIGIDMGIKTLYTDSNGYKCPNPKFSKKLEKRLKFSQKSLSRKKKDGKNREKARIKVAKIYRKIANQRRDYLHKESKKIINENQVICLETLNIKSMFKHKLKKVNRSISDTGLGMFIDMLKYKSDLYGRQIKTVPKYYPSSQKCSSCGSIHKGMKKLTIRTMICKKCGKVLDRDINAALNILKGC